VKRNQRHAGGSEMKADDLVLNGIWHFTLPLLAKYRNEVDCTVW